ncbi:MAG: hypothetical protein HY037_03595 [Nitrospirae bacterium]|nr:hypothetical protein [Candidatus Troglogloeales bacterium]
MPNQTMIKVGLWIQTETDEVFIVKKDPSGHPVLTVFRSPNPLESTEDKKAKLRELYDQLTGRTHPHPHATSRQLMWDFLEAAIKQLP